jgi:hypothetical protein
MKFLFPFDRPFFFPAVGLKPKGFIFLQHTVRKTDTGLNQEGILLLFCAFVP